MSPPGSRPIGHAPSSLEGSARNALINELTEQVARHYVFPTVGAHVAEAIRRRHLAGEYEDIADPAVFAQTLTRHLREASDDRHFGVLYPPPPRPPGGVQPGGPPTEEERAARRHEATLMNFGIHRVERLAGNVGYLDLRRFYEAELAADALVAALRLVANSLALIVDLRKNGGGQPSTMTLLCSYLLGAEPVHYCDIRWRETGDSEEPEATEPAERVVQSWTHPYVPIAPYNPDRPLYVLASRQTFSAAEAVAYCLQNRRRATIIGERTGGGAHVSSGIYLSADFGLSIPTGRVVDPLTGTNWERTGVVPDVELPAGDALTFAHAAALRHVLAVVHDATSKPAKALREDAERTLTELEPLLPSGSAG